MTNFKPPQTLDTLIQQGSAADLTRVAERLSRLTESVENHIDDKLKGKTGVGSYEHGVLTLVVRSRKDLYLARYSVRTLLPALQRLPAFSNLKKVDWRLAPEGVKYLTGAGRN